MIYITKKRLTTRDVGCGRVVQAAVGVGGCGSCSGAGRGGSSSKVGKGTAATIS